MLKMRRKFRFTNIEERKNLRKTIFFGGLSLCLLVILFIYGIPTIARVASFVSELGKTNQPIDVADTIPPAPPRFETTPEATNKVTLDLKGYSEAGALVILEVNRKKHEVVADGNGEFSLTVELLSGDNFISAIARDTAGNESQPSREIKIVFDNKAPTLEVTNPKDETEYSGSAQRQITIQGSTEPGVKVTINERTVTVLEDGMFSYTTSLSDGENKFRVLSTDIAGNYIEKELTLRFNP